MSFTLSNAGPVSITLPDYNMMQRHHAQAFIVNMFGGSVTDASVNGIHLLDLLLEYGRYLNEENAALREQVRTMSFHQMRPIIVEKEGRKYREDGL